ncbi:hypothetical protein Brms1b_008155 [Colletotrichum noveboracense]|nr:hypothetical protein Brms1b_008155 [Colletotrichum noveboracense]
MSWKEGEVEDADAEDADAEDEGTDKARVRRVPGGQVHGQHQHHASGGDYAGGTESPFKP